MEFESNSPQASSGGISDEMRLNAATRRTTLTPLHEDVLPDDESEERAVADHILSAPVANLPIDSETTTKYEGVQEKATPRAHTVILPIVIILCIVALAIAGVLYVVMFHK